MTVKIHNSSLGLKVKQRQDALAFLGPAKKWRVLETHGGRGILASKVYEDVALRCSTDTDVALTNNIHCPAEDFLRAVDLNKFNVFDVDPYGAPWEYLWIISRRRAATEPIVLFITSGDVGGLNMIKKTAQQRGWSTQMVEVIGEMSPQSLLRNAESVTRRLLGAWFSAWQIVGGSSARSANGKVFYYAVQLAPRAETVSTPSRQAKTRRSRA